jgi:hypothetical protein
MQTIVIRCLATRETFIPLASLRPARALLHFTRGYILTSSCVLQSVLKLKLYYALTAFRFDNHYAK